MTSYESSCFCCWTTKYAFSLDSRNLCLQTINRLFSYRYGEATIIIPLNKIESYKLDAHVSPQAGIILFLIGLVMGIVGSVLDITYLSASGYTLLGTGFISGILMCCRASEAGTMTIKAGDTHSIYIYAAEIPDIIRTFSDIEMRTV